jgi:hypothetical protein
MVRSVAVVRNGSAGLIPTVCGGLSEKIQYPHNHVDHRSSPDKVLGLETGVTTFAKPDYLELAPE